MQRTADSGQPAPYGWTGLVGGARPNERRALPCRGHALTAHHPITSVSGARDWFMAGSLGMARFVFSSNEGERGRPRVLRKCGLSLQTANLPPCKFEIEQASHGHGDGMGWRKRACMGQRQPVSPWLRRSRRAPYLACRGSLAREEIMCVRVRESKSDEWPSQESARTSLPPTPPSHQPRMTCSCPSNLQGNLFFSPFRSREFPRRSVLPQPGELREDPAHLIPPRHRGRAQVR